MQSKAKEDSLTRIFDTRFVCRPWSRSVPSLVMLPNLLLELGQRLKGLKAKTRMSRRLGFLGTKSYMDLLAFGGDVKPEERRQGHQSLRFDTEPPLAHQASK